MYSKLVKSTSEILFEKFEIIECLKKDEHASVYLADHIYLGKKIILKALNTETISDNTKIERFKREAKIMAKLDHPNIIKVLDFGTFKEFFYISFEYFESKSLRSFIKDKSLSAEQKQELIIQLFQGLAYAHQNQIIHRDIKPENILVNKDHQLKIGDFGLALTLNDNFITGQYAIVGTPCYMSPEQVQGKKLTVQSDLFSAGIVAFELFTGLNPFLGNDVNETISNVINFNKERLEKYSEHLPGEMWTVIAGLLNKKQEHRFNNAEEVLKTLNVPVKTSADKSFAFMHNRKLQVGSGAAIILIIIIFFSFHLTDMTQEQDDMPLNENEIGESRSGKTDTDNTQEDLTPEKPAPENNKPVDHEPQPSESGNKIYEEETTQNTQEEIADNAASEDNLNSDVARFGSLYIECTPWAHVYIENKRLDTTPLSSPINLQAGTYNIKLIHPSYPEFVQTVSIKPDETTNLTLNLDELFGYLSCKVFPWGNVFVDNGLVGQTPLTEPIKLMPGEHKLTITNPNYSDYQRTVEIAKEETLFIHINLNEISKKELGSNQ